MDRYTESRDLYGTETRPCRTGEYLVGVDTAGDGFEVVYHAVEATDVGEACLYLERQYAGQAFAGCLILAEDYPEARRIGVEFNEADGRVY